MKLCIIGGGAFGCALASQLKKRHSITIIESSPAQRKRISSTLHCTVHPNIDNQINAFDCIIISVSSRSFARISSLLSTHLTRRIPILCASKGISSSGDVLTSLLESLSNISPDDVFALSGPSLAGELSSGALTELVIGGSRKQAVSLSHILTSGSILCRPTSDKVGIQLLGCYKNIIAILIGIARGCGCKTNTVSALLSAAYRELYYSCSSVMHRHTFLDYAGLGDVFLTVSSSQSRNNQFGYNIGTGLSVAESLEQVGSLVEGYNAYTIIRSLPDDHYLNTRLIKTLTGLFSSSSDKYSVLVNYLIDMNGSW